MKEPEKLRSVQLNLPLLSTPAMAVPDHKKRELALALVELLISAANESVGHESNGGGDDPETDY